ncbi:hypothetical protein BDR03DRAFT_987545 [Suillus americanus]|nr:hypothetical protein BDR03DRAFT_987545 [Suillus americanus]
MSTNRYKCSCARCSQHPDRFTYQTRQVITKHAKKYPPVLQPTGVETNADAGENPMNDASGASPESEGTNNRERPEIPPQVREDEYDFDFQHMDDQHAEEQPGYPAERQAPVQELQDFNFRPVAWPDVRVPGSDQDQEDRPHWTVRDRAQDNQLATMKLTEHRYGLHLTLNIDWMGILEHRPHSSGPIYYAINDLPRDQRFLQVNVICAAIMPGPKEPNIVQINHCLEPSTRELMELKNGVKMDVYGEEELADVFADNEALACDMPASHKCNGTAGHSHDFHPCYNNSWTDKNDHHMLRQSVYSKDATTARQEAILRDHGVKFSILNVIPGWLPSKKSALDFMHCIFLEIISHLFMRVLFGGYMLSGMGGVNSPKRRFEDIINAVRWPSHVTRLPKNSSENASNAHWWQDRAATDTIVAERKGTLFKLLDIFLELLIGLSFRPVSYIKVTLTHKQTGDFPLKPLHQTLYLGLELSLVPLDNFITICPMWSVLLLSAVIISDALLDALLMYGGYIILMPCPLAVYLGSANRTISTMVRAPKCLEEFRVHWTLDVLSGVVHPTIVKDHSDQWTGFANIILGQAGIVFDCEAYCTQIQRVKLPMDHQQSGYSDDMGDQQDLQEC